MRHLFRFNVSLGWGVILVLIANTVGCGTGGLKTGFVTGTVTHGGEVVPQGLVNFASKSGFAVSATLDRDGVYTARSQHGEGIPLGIYQVSITSVPLTDKEVVQALKGSSTTAPPSTDLINIPKKYCDFGTSRLTVEVQEGINVFDIDLDPETKPGT